MRYLLIGLMLFWSNAVAFAATIDQIRVSHNENLTRLVLDLDDKVTFESFTLQNPARIVIDVNQGRTNKHLKLPVLAETPVKNIRQGQHDNNTLRLVLDLNEEVDFSTRTLNPSGHYPHRLVIDLTSGKKLTQITETENHIEAATNITPAMQSTVLQRVKKAPLLPRRNIVIAIDPGHGGRDPGAIGKGGTREKDVVLQISRRLAALVDAEPGMRASLTRSGDEFISLRQRIQRAKQSGADMFISIHADAFHKPQARGSSVYVLSERGASSEAAQILADRENAADLAGGISLEDKDDLLASVLLDLSQTASLQASLEVGNTVLSGLKRVGNVHKKQVESAAFVVLKSPDIPSVLVETAFISNPQEEANLKNAQHQNKLAHAMMAGIRTYFQRNPITHQERPQQHIVSSGDTLSTIAQRYQVQMNKLITTNDLQTTQLSVGDVLRIP